MATTSQAGGPGTMALFILCALLLNAPPIQAATKGVTASLNAKWPATPLLLETSEFIAEDSDEKFWQFVDTVRELTIYRKADSGSSYYSLLLKKAAQFVTDLQINLLKFALALRVYSPAVQMFQQYYLRQLLGGPKPYLYKSDHTFPGINGGDPPVVILYAELGTNSFNNFHKVLSEKAENGEIVYVLRHFVASSSSGKMHLSGYGVELAIKSTEYRAVDDTQVKDTNMTVLEDGEDGDEVQGFLFENLKKVHPDMKEELGELRKHLIESTNDMAPLKVWELQDLSYQAAARITSAPKYDAMKLMRDISQNFPTKARSLTKTVVNQEMRKEIEENQKHLTESLGINPGDSALFINGLQIDLDTQNAFSVLDIIRGEGKTMEGLHDLGIKNNDLSKLLRLAVHPPEDSFALDIRHPAVMWVNDIETDHLYQSWPSSCQELLRQTFPGVIRQIRRNFFSLVLFIHPAQEETVELVKLAELFYQHRIPLRIGFVFVVNTDEKCDGNKDAGVALFRALNYIAEEYDFAQAFSSMVSIYNKVKSGDVLTVDRVVGFLKKKYPRADALRIIGLDSQYDDKRKAGGIFYRKSGLGALPQALFNGVPFSSEEMDPEELETVLLQRIVEATGFLQRSVFMGQLTDETDVVEYHMDQPNVVPRINALILSLRRRYLDLTAKPAIQDWYDTSTFSFLDSIDKTAVIAANMKYLTKNDEDIIYAGSIWIIADFDMPSGRRLLSNALKHMKSSSNTRIGVVSNPAAKPTEENTVIARAIMAAILTQKKKEAFHFVMKLIKEESGMDNDGFEKKHNTLGVDFIRTQQLFCQDVVKLQPGQMAVVINGRILGPFDENEEFHAEDFHLLEKITFSSSTEKIKVKVKQMGMKAKQASDLVMKVDALLTSAPKGETRRDVRFIKDELSVVQLPPREDEVYYDVVAVVDPLTREAQKVAPLLIVLGQVINMKLRVFMNCKPKLSERPLKSFYRYVLEPDVTFLANNTLSPGPVAKFLEMPESPLLTLNMITPESWLVEAVQSSHDLDNIHLQEIDSIVKAEYELEYLLLEGHCFDVTTGQPPRGLQFTLGVKMAPLIQDTIVMANLFPERFCHVFSLCLISIFLFRVQARLLYKHFGIKLYSLQIEKKAVHDGTDSPADSDNVIVVLNSFHSKIINVKVQKRADKINEDLLSDGTEDKGLWESITSFTGGSPSDDAKKEKADILNIFSVASGHLYERFLRIMMLSVLRHTKTPVKFWFLKNYLSPMFKESIPHMAKAYDFQYELVQYKWPRWLHQQTEKQRIIWGHKILFLDVLFPLAVDKIIFVDADQIVRADLKELRDLDLKGAPYGYTPFCDSRKEMDGYRFWKSGYWASHLANRKYHISALYVVDLKKFRKIAAGDRLRGQYQALSQDPNSLSNLDQDLPNNMIHQVAIKSLPQEWLWCETWCDDHSKKTAKTIDLCNNPKTKEPKLKAAMRIVPEWVEYDNEIKHLLKQLEEQKNIQVNRHAKSKGNKEYAQQFLPIKNTIDMPAPIPAIAFEKAWHVTAAV
ncbi:UDP-glucose:glycoprotein glucosyltransferase 2 [Acipenser ruthenus]|uniref:UDP-glucose ceramide glucosyltransferase-like 1 n=1 Tax=Acipenser ruthenus TaxID=7906 RepID=A0A662YZT0_ACIRT|nr:UDP-glucose:glycoprotein glucosyltransferase 2 [Acipenser ruthenus]